MPNPAKLITVGTEALTLKQWSARHGVPASTIDARLRAGKSPAEAVSTPPDRRFRPVHTATRQAVRPCPRLKRHKATGQAYCEWVTAGERNFRYFGQWESAEAEQGYGRFQLEWATRLVRRSSVQPGDTLLVAELVEAWLDYCEHGDDGEGGYRKRGKLTSGVHAQRAAMNYLTPVYGLTGVDGFGPDQLRAVRKGMLDAALARKTINGYQAHIVQMFGWGVGRQLVPADVWRALQQVGRLQKGKTAAPDKPKKRAAAWADVEATFPHLHHYEPHRATLEVLVRVHWLLGGRPQDLVTMRAGDIDRTGDVWRYVVDGHKNEHRDQELEYWVGPKAQALLAPLLDGKAAGDLVFVYPAADGGRPAPIRREVYGRRVKAACKGAGVKAWTPHQLRKSRATEVMRIYESNEAAAAVIGDSEEVARTIYVDPLEAVKKRIARQTG